MTLSPMQDLVLIRILSQLDADLIAKFGTELWICNSLDPDPTNTCKKMVFYLKIFENFEIIL